MLGPFAGPDGTTADGVQSTKHLQLTHDHSDGFLLVASERNSHNYVFCCRDVSTDEYYARSCTHFGDISKQTKQCCIRTKSYILRRTRLIVKLEFCNNNAMAQRGLNLACGKHKLVFYVRQLL